MTRVKKSVTPKMSGFVHTDEWEGFTPGDAVKVSTTFWDGKRGLKWEYRCHVLNTTTGAQWLEVWGGPRGHETMRSFAVDAVTLIPKRKRRQRRAA